MHEDAAEVLIILFDAMIQSFYLGLGKEPENVFLELPRTLAGDDFNQRNFFRHGFSHHPVEFGLDRRAAVINIMKVQCQFSQFASDAAVNVVIV